MLVGYARTSTADQKAGLAAQERDLQAAGADKVFAEQVSSVAQRAGLKACLEFMREGDALVVTKPDRLARSTADLLAIEADLSRRGIGMVVLSMGGERLDTRNPTSKLMLTILGGVATWEREIMLERQREGIAKAKAEGKYKGRKPLQHDLAFPGRHAAEDGQHQLAGWVPRVEPLATHRQDHHANAAPGQVRLDRQQFGRGPSEPVRLGHNQRVPLPHELPARLQSRALRHAGHLLCEHLVCPGGL